MKILPYEEGDKVLSSIFTGLSSVTVLSLISTDAMGSMTIFIYTVFAMIIYMRERYEIST